MIVTDSSALMTVLLREPGWEAVRTALEHAEVVHISAATLVEVNIVALRRDVADELDAMLNVPPIVVADVGAEEAGHAVQAYRRWGKGFHAAHLNFGDCFSYALARQKNLPLLFVGRDFAATDVIAAIPTA
ncbi:type II toxin-antitoxin system VapC family toxin [Mongoliimonas terrestris]|uniref:type II toxin-antitoxin system VapC family toxin n=1 Tax=Mongoliimonas terrestris TaxID=1709001 RepID=UPI000949AA6C|nr:type II toxin-antitoxin system VapC family toxin [Mongoliimonas terrestris]